MRRIPITILAGSDAVAGKAEGPTAGLHPLGTYKGAHLRIAGRPLASVLAERLVATGGFGPVSVAGPLRIFREACPELECIDTDSSVGRNLRRAIARHRETNGGPLAVIACDILPTTDELRALRESWAAGGESALWFPLVLDPADPSELGAFAWKPRYRIAPRPGADALTVLPGHLGIVDPEALRWPLIDRLFDSGYRARNRGLLVKRAAMLRAVIAGLVATDLRLVASGRAPTRTITTLSAGFGIVRRLRSSSLDLPALESAIGRMLLRRSHRRRPGWAGVRLPLIDTLSLARDIDTLEEARSIARLELDETPLPRRDERQVDPSGTGEPA